VTTALPARLPRFRLLPAWGLPLLLAGLATAPGRSDPPVASVYGRVGAAPAAGAGAPDTAGQAERIVTSACAAFARCDSVSVKLRQKARIGPRTLVGTGRYLQSGQGENQRFRFESTLTCDSESFEVTEVCDGLFFWGHRRHGADRPTLQRIDVRRVREKLQQLGLAEPVDSAPYLGGLPRVLWLVRQRFRFAAAVPGDLRGLPVWIVDGRWDPEALAGLLPDLADAARRPEGVPPERLPDGVPWGVRFAIGQADLLPLRLEWLAIPGVRPVSAAEPEPIAVLELDAFEFDAPVEPAAFFYQPAGEGLIDVSEMHVKGLQPMRP